MTRKDYEVIAMALRVSAPIGMPATVEFEVWAGVVETMADALAQENARFNRGRFLESCLPRAAFGQDRQARCKGALGL